MLTISPHRPHRHLQLETVCQKLLHGFSGPQDKRHLQLVRTAVGDQTHRRGGLMPLARLRERGVFCVSRLHQKRKVNLRAARRLGHDDWRVTWRRPEQWLASCGVSAEEFKQLPETLEVRIVRITHVPRGFRSRPVWVSTTLVDPIETPADEIRALYRDRWMAGICIV